MLLLVVLIIILIFYINTYCSYGTDGGGEVKIKITDEDGSIMKAIVDGKKTVEGRKTAKYFTKLEPGDKFIFVSDKDMLECELVNVKNYESIEAFFDDNPVESVLPGGSLEDAISSYKKLNDVDNERIAQIAERNDGKWFSAITFKYISRVEL